MNVKGGLLIEAILSLPVILIAIAFALELERRAQYEGLTYRLVCEYARARRLGQPSVQAKSRLRAQLSLGISEREARLWSHSLEDGALPGSAKLHIRYPALFFIPGKHHFEITQECRF